MEIYVRRAERSDVPQMIPLLEQLDAWHRENYPERFRKHIDGGRTPHNLIKEMVDPSAEYWLAVKSGKVLGVAYFMHRQLPSNPLVIPNDYLLLDMLVVDERYRRKGVGKLLVDQAKKRAQEEGYPRVVIKVYEANQEAIGFYQELGYETEMRKMTLKIDKK